MNMLVIWALLGGLVFQEQEIPDFYASSGVVLTQQKPLGEMPCDLNQDGKQDLFLSQRIMLQIDGIYPESGYVDLPELPNQSKLQIWNNQLFVKHLKGVQQYQWGSGAWTLLQDHPINWADNGPVFPVEAGEPEIEPFLHDFNGDTVPEVVALTNNSIVVYAMVNGSFTEKLEAIILPEIVVEMPDAPRLWPAEERRYAHPGRHMGTNIAFEGDVVRVYERTRVPGDKRKFTVWAYRLNIETGTVEQLGMLKETAILEPRMRPMALNDDDTLDVFFYKREYTTSSAMPAPIQVIRASLDGGESWYSFHARHLPNTVCIPMNVDINGDGLVDIVQERVKHFDHGIRESLTAMLTRKKIEHEVAIYLQDEQGFPKQPSYTLPFEFEFEKPPIRNDATFYDYTLGLRLSLVGDFNGDGWKDIAVQEKLDKIEIRDIRSQEKLGEITLAAHRAWDTVDVNGDGLCDIYMPDGGLLFYKKQFSAHPKVLFNFGEAP